MDHFTDDAREQRGVGWLILCVSLTGPSDIWLTIILGVSVRVLLDEITIRIRRLSKADGRPLV